MVVKGGHLKPRGNKNPFTAKEIGAITKYYTTPQRNRLYFFAIEVVYLLYNLSAWELQSVRLGRTLE